MNAVTTRGPGALSAGGSGSGGGDFGPQNFTELMRWAEIVSNTTLVPKDYVGKPGNIVVAVQWGKEIGLSPMQALSNIASINGRPAVWGDAALALVMNHPACEDVVETLDGDGDAMTARCETKCRGRAPVVRTFSVGDAKKAQLWGKAGPWQQYPTRMLQLRARGFCLRDAFPDVLRGLVTAEEAQDIPPEPRDVTPARSAPRPAERVVGLAPQRTALPAPTTTPVEEDSIPALDPEPPPPGSMREEAQRIQAAKPAQTPRDRADWLIQRVAGSDGYEALTTLLRHAKVAGLREELRVDHPGLSAMVEDAIAAAEERVAPFPADLPLDGHPAERAAEGARGEA